MTTYLGFSSVVLHMKIRFGAPRYNPSLSVGNYLQKLHYLSQSATLVSARSKPSVAGLVDVHLGDEKRMPTIQD